MPEIIYCTDHRNGQTQSQEWRGDVFRIGKNPDNDLVLEQQGLSRQHCEIRRHPEGLVVRDLNSRNGTYINGRRISKPVLFRTGMEIRLGDYSLRIEENSSRGGGTHPALKVPRKQQSDTATEMPRSRGGLQEERRVTPVELKKKIHATLLERMDLKHQDMSNRSQEELRMRTTDICTQVVQELAREVPSWLMPGDLVKEIVDEAVGLGCLEDLLADETITEVMVNSWDTVYVERKGRIELSNRQFTDNQQVVQIIRRILAPIGRRIDETNPMADGRLRDGSRVNAIIPPLSLSGPTLTIRKFSKTPFKVDDLIGFGSLTSNMAEFMSLAVKNRANIVIAGGTGSGKTTLLNVTSNYIPSTERIVTVEDSAELQLAQPHVVRLESRPANLEGKNAVHIRDLVRNCLRMRPDRIVVGECRGGEALDMLQAMNTGHDGSLTTLHANSPRDTLSRLETLVLMAGMDLPSRAIREQIASAVDFIIQASRLSDGSRKITHISGVTGMEGDIITLQHIFVFEQEGFDTEGNVRGRFKATGEIPEFVQDLRARGIDVNMDIFREAGA